MDKLITKLTWKCKGPIITKTILKTIKMRRLALLDFKTDYKAIVIKIMGDSNLRINVQINGTKQSPETAQNIYGQLIFKKMPR